MSHSELINELASALSKAQGEMQAAIKNKINPFFGKPYADLGSVWDAARPVLSKYGLCVMQTTELDREKNQTIIVTTLAHSSGQWMKSYLPINPSKNDCQGVGAAITYLRRYSLSSILGVVGDDDDDGETDSGRGKKKESTQSEHKEPNQPTKKEHTSIEKVGKDESKSLNSLFETLDKESRKIFIDWIKKNFNADALYDVPKSAFDKCIFSLNQRIKFLKDKEQMAVAV